MLVLSIWQSMLQKPKKCLCNPKLSSTQANPVRKYTKSRNKFHLTTYYKSFLQLSEKKDSFTSFRFDRRQRVPLHCWDTSWDRPFRLKPSPRSERADRLSTSKSALLAHGCPCSVRIERAAADGSRNTGHEINVCRT